MTPTGNEERRVLARDCKRWATKYWSPTTVWRQPNEARAAFRSCCLCVPHSVVVVHGTELLQLATRRKCLKSITYATDTPAIMLLRTMKLLFSFEQVRKLLASFKSLSFFREASFCVPFC
jgi:hypothetical protein